MANVYRPNIYIRVAPGEGYVVQEGPEVTVYGDPQEAREADPRFRQAYKQLLAGASAATSGRLQTTASRELTPSCRAISATFQCEGKEAELAIFTERYPSHEATLAVQVILTDPDGRHVEFYSRDPRQRRLFDSFLASSAAFIDDSEKR